MGMGPGSTVGLGRFAGTAQGKGPCRSLMSRSMYSAHDEILSEWDRARPSGSAGLPGPLKGKDRADH
jgi:hypothetical protein